MSEQVKLGQEVRDTVTGLQGIATGRAEYLGGSASVQIQAKKFDKGLPVAAVWVEEARVEVVSVVLPGELAAPEAPDPEGVGEPAGAEEGYPAP